MPGNVSRTRTAVRYLLAALSLVTTLAGSYVFAALLWSHGGGVLHLLLFALFVVLFLWISFSFWTATLGFVKCLSRSGCYTVPPVRESTDSSANFDLPRTAIVVPVYNEPPARVFAGLRACLESLRETGRAERFDLFVLSDTTDPEIWLEEELAWARLRDGYEGPSGVFYRRRQKNTGRKSGNIRDFCERWGARYKYMVVFDADSIMAGATLVEMVRRMEEDPQVGILQAPVVPVNRSSLFARTQQFAARVYGEIFTTGFALWTRTDGNYWGHNAIIRVQTFMDHCRLPRLPGPAPLGGEILSHDFVEAALIRRAGFKVIVAHDLADSYEECPTTLSDFAKRDQRWCQGNMQHLRLLFVYGFHPVSRMHLAMGAMSYLSSPLWLLFMVLGIVVGSGKPGPRRPSLTHNLPLMQSVSSEDLVLIVFLGTMALLFLPKLWGWLLLLRDPVRLRAQGGAFRTALSVLLEACLSVLMAPVFMVFHVSFVVSTLLGRSVEWTAQRRGESATAVREAIGTHALTTLGSLVAALLIARLAPEMFWWTLPVLLGLVASVPLDVLLSSVRVGRWLRRRGLLLIPEETQMPKVLKRQRTCLAELQEVTRATQRVSALHRVVVDPMFQALHVAMLRGSKIKADSVSDDRLHRIRQVALHAGPTYLTREHQLLLLADEASMDWLHRAAWSQWPLETLRMISRLVVPAPSPRPA